MHTPHQSGCFSAAALATMLLLAGCGGGGGGGGGGAGSGTGALQPFAIDIAASPALASDVRDLIEVGDHFEYEPDTVQANDLYDQLWARLLANGTWIDASDNDSYQFFNDNDPNTAWGRAYRFDGFNFTAGPVVPFTFGTYTRANGQSLPALTLRTWDSQHAELLVMVDDDTFVHCIQNSNGLPIVELYHGS